MWSQTVLLGILLIISLYFMHATLAQNTTTSEPTSDPLTTTTSFYTTTDPTPDPTSPPTMQPSTTTTSYYTTYDPTEDPTDNPSYYPTFDPTYHPTFDPTYDPTYYPTYYPTFDPTYDPTRDPTRDPTHDPTPRPTDFPTGEPTQEPTEEPTIEPTVNPITTTEIDTTSTTEEEEDDDKKWRVFCRFILRLFRFIRIATTNAAEETSITDEEIQTILIATIEDQVDVDFDIVNKDIKLNKTEDPNNTNYTIYRFDVVILTATEAEANLVQDTIESEDFVTELQGNVETEARTTVTAQAVVTDIEAPEEECKVTLWNPFTYQDCPDQILPWILLGAAACILCVLILCFIRCCYLCCTRGRRMNRRKSKYEVGGVMFAPIESVNAEQESAFQSDLRTAIEMNKAGKLLKETNTSLDLDGDAVATAFDMDFDEIKPIKSNANGGAKQQKIKKATSADDHDHDNDEKKETEDKKKDDDKTKGKDNNNKKKGSEGAMPMTTGITPGGPYTTPGGPTPGGPDDEDNPPPAPAPPLNQMTDYDLL